MSLFRQKWSLLPIIHGTVYLRINLMTSSPNKQTIHDKIRQTVSWPCVRPTISCNFMFYPSYQDIVALSTLSDLRNLHYLSVLQILSILISLDKNVGSTSAVHPKFATVNRLHNQELSEIQSTEGSIWPLVHKLQHTSKLLSCDRCEATWHLEIEPRQANF